MKISQIEMGKVYWRRITDTALLEEDYVDGIICIYDYDIFDII